MRHFGLIGVERLMKRGSQFGVPCPGEFVRVASRYVCKQRTFHTHQLGRQNRARFRAQLVHVLGGSISAESRLATLLNEG